jgi:hypothetical protein
VGRLGKAYLARVRGILVERLGKAYLAFHNGNMMTGTIFTPDADKVRLNRFIREYLLTLREHAET